MAIGGTAVASRRVVELSIVGKGVDQEGRRLQSALKSLENRANRATSAFGKSNNSIKGFNLSLRSIGTGLGSIAAFTGIGAGIAGIGAAFTEATRAASQFDSALSELSAITGATGRDLAFLSDQAIDISQNSRTAARDVLIGFKLIGSAKPELLESGEALAEVTRQAVLLSEAAGIDLASAAKATATSLNQFGEGADQAARFVNVLAAGSQLGSAEVDALNVAVTKAGTSAAGANVSFEEFIGLVGRLAKSGEPIETIGTGLKNIFITLESGARDTRPSVVGLDQALENLANQQLDTAEIAKRFGRENFNVIKSMLAMRREADDLEKSITGTNKAFEQASTRADNLEGDWDKLGNAFTNLSAIIIEKATAIRSAVQLATDALNALAEFSRDIERSPIAAAQERLAIANAQITAAGPSSPALPELRREQAAAKTAVEALTVALEKQAATFTRLDTAAASANDNFPPRPRPRPGDLDTSVGSGKAADLIREMDSAILAFNAHQLEAAENLQKLFQTENQEIANLKALEQAAAQGADAYTSMRAQIEAIEIVRQTGNEAINAETGEMTNATLAVKAYLEQRDLLNESIDKSVEAFETSEEKFKGFADAMKKDLPEIGQAIQTGLAGGLTDVLFSIRNAKDAFADFAKSFLDQIGRMIVQQIIFNAISSATGGGIGGLFAQGAAFQGGNVVPFNRGTVVSQPTFFPMARGNIGLMGEAGPEAIMPLQRDRSGRLGVSASGGGQKVVINNFAGADVQVVRNDEELIEIAVQRSRAAAEADFTRSMQTGHGSYAKGLEGGFRVRRNLG